MSEQSRESLLDWMIVFRYDDISSLGLSFFIICKYSAMICVLANNGETIKIENILLVYIL